MHNRQEIRDVDVTIEFSLFVRGQLALVRFIHQFLHARTIGLAEIEWIEDNGRLLGKSVLWAPGSDGPKWPVRSSHWLDEHP
jgi:hypothetical protein